MPPTREGACGIRFLGSRALAWSGLALLVVRALVLLIYAGLGHLRGGSLDTFGFWPVTFYVLVNVLYASPAQGKDVHADSACANFRARTLTHLVLVLSVVEGLWVSVRVGAADDDSHERTALSLLTAVHAADAFVQMLRLDLLNAHRRAILTHAALAPPPVPVTGAHPSARAVLRAFNIADVLLLMGGMAATILLDRTTHRVTSLNAFGAMTQRYVLVVEMLTAATFPDMYAPAAGRRAALLVHQMLDLVVGGVTVVALGGRAIASYDLANTLDTAALGAGAIVMMAYMAVLAGLSAARLAHSWSTLRIFVVAPPVPRAAPPSRDVAVDIPTPQLAGRPARKGLLASLLRRPITHGVAYAADIASLAAHAILTVLVALANFLPDERAGGHLTQLPTAASVFGWFAVALLYYAHRWTASPRDRLAARKTHHMRASLAIVAGLCALMYGLLLFGHTDAPSSLGHTIFVVLVLTVFVHIVLAAVSSAQPVRGGGAAVAKKAVPGGASGGSSDDTSPASAPPLAMARPFATASARAVPSAQFGHWPAGYVSAGVYR
jgi:hypothetical protein